jgi:hypothetical protein
VVLLLLLVVDLQDSLQTAKGPVLPDSSILLLRIPAPVLFVHGGACGCTCISAVYVFTSGLLQRLVPIARSVADVWPTL